MTTTETIAAKPMTADRYLSRITQRILTATRIGERPLADVPAADIRVYLRKAYAVAVAHDAKATSVSPETEAVIEQTVAALKDPAHWGVTYPGSVGTGKTTMLKALQAVINGVHDSDVSSRSRRLRMVTAKQVADALKRREEKGDGGFEDWATTEWLAIDDIGTEPREVLAYGTPLHPIAEIICRRYERRLWTAISTNLTGQQIETSYGIRVHDRLREMCRLIPMVGESHRK